MAGGQSSAIGDRSINVQGDFNGVAVTGDYNWVINFPRDADCGALIEQLRAALVPGKRLRPSPLRAVPAAFTTTIDRDDEVAAITGALVDGPPVNVHGDKGVGKTHALLRALNAAHPALDGNAAYIDASGPLDDVLQCVFETWYECDRPHVVSPATVRDDLRAVTGVVALDSVTLERDRAQQLVLALPNASLVVASRSRRLWEGTAVPIRGLGQSFAEQLVMAAVGRRLTAAERPSVERIISVLGGHPLKIREAVATFLEQGRTLEDLAAAIDDVEPLATIAAEKLRAAGPDGRRLLAMLALFGDAGVGEAHLRGILEISDFDEVLEGARRRRDVSEHDRRFALGIVIAASPASLDPSSARAATMHFARWAHALRAEPLAILEEGDGLLALLRSASALGLHREVIDLGRSVDAAFALGRRFAAWREVLELVREAALELDDQAAEAWALHQLGTRALSLGDRATGAELLGQAIAMRRELGDVAGERASVYNLGAGSRGPGVVGWIFGHRLWATLIALAVVLGGGALAAALASHSPSVRAAIVSVQVDGPGQVISDATGIHCPSVCSARFRPSTPVTLDATAGSKASFGGWEGACSGQATCMIRASGTVTVLARFIAVKPVVGRASLTVIADGAGSVHSIPAGIRCPAVCTARFTPGTNVTLVAVSSPDDALASWRGDCAGSGECRLTMSGDHSVSAIFAAIRLSVEVSGDGSVVSDPSGIDCPGRCSAPFSDGQTVSLSDRTGTGAQFDSWTGACGSAQTCALRMTGDRDVGAEFSGAPAPTLSVTTDGPGVGSVVSADGAIDCGGSCSASYPKGASVTLTAHPSGSSTFAGWSGACRGVATSCRVSMAALESVAARFVAAPTVYPLVVAESGPGSGSVATGDGDIECSPKCQASYAAGERVILNAAVASGSTFTGWSGACHGSSPSCTITMSAAERATADFVPAPAALTVATAGAGSGTVTSSDQKIRCSSTCVVDYAREAQVTLTATAAAGSVFRGWSGACSGTGACSVKMGAAESVTAMFAVSTFELSVAAVGGTVTSGDGKIVCPTACSGSYPLNSVVALTEMPGAGETFKGWSGACSGTGACSVKMSAAQSVTAMFAVSTFELSVAAVGGTVTSGDGKIVCPATCSGSYPLNSVVALTEMPGAGETFKGWSGACSGTGACSVKMGAAESVTAMFAVSTFELSVAAVGGTVTSGDGKIVCPTACSGSYPLNSVVALTEMPGAGETFKGWSGACSGTGACSVKMGAAESVTAMFAVSTFELSVAAVGGTVTSGDGKIVCPTACSGSYPLNSVVALTEMPGAGETFKGWSGACSGTGACSVKMGAAESVTATFAVSTFELSVAAVGGTVTSGDGKIVCPTACSGSYPLNSVVALTEMPGAGETFKGWSGACSGTGACSVKMGAAESVTATFAVSTFELSVAAVGGTVTSGDGKIVCPATCSGSYPLNSVVALTEMPGAGETFKGWSGACSGTGACSVKMGAAESVTATFAEASTVSLGVVVTGAGPGSVLEDVADRPVVTCTHSSRIATRCMQAVPSGAKVILTAKPSLGSEFVEWSGACHVRSLTCVLYPRGTLLADAEFALVPMYSLMVGVSGDGSVTSAPGAIDCSGPDATGVCQANYDGGAAVTLTASPNPDARFEGWSGSDSCVVSSADTAQVVCTLGANTTESATFAAAYGVTEAFRGR